MANDPNRQGQYPPPQWETGPQRGAYPGVPHQGPPPPQAYRGPPPQGYPSNAPAPGEMVTLPPPPHQQGHPPHMYPAPHEMYPAYAQHGLPPPHVGYAPSQPAPRQRTAIACRYCRRRKIRCSGFDSSEDGRCSNCQRFQQECIFTPVSSQAQAFVPAHTAYPHLRQQGAMPQRGGRVVHPYAGQPAIYGAHGQPLGPPMHDPNYPPPHPYAMPPQGYGAPPYDDRGVPPQPARPQDNVSLKRLRSDEFHPPIPPPSQNGGPSSPSLEGAAPIDPSRRASPGAVAAAGAGGAPGLPGSSGNGAGPPPISQGYEYPDPSSLAPVSPGSSAQTYPAPYPPQGQPYYPTHPPPPHAQPIPAHATTASAPQALSQQQQQQGETSVYAGPPQTQAGQEGTPRGSASPGSNSVKQAQATSKAETTSKPSKTDTERDDEAATQAAPTISGSANTAVVSSTGSEGSKENGNGNRAGMAVRDLLGPAGQDDQDSSSKSKADDSTPDASNKTV